MWTEEQQQEILKILRPLYHSAKGDYNSWKKGKGDLTKVEAQEKLKKLFTELEFALVKNLNGSY